MPTLLEMAQDYRDLLDAVEDEEGQEVLVPGTGEVIEGDEFLARLYALEGDIERKVDGCCAVVKELEAAGAALREIEKRYAQRRQAFERRTEHLKRYLAAQMVEVKREKVKTLHFTVYFGAVPQRLIIDTPDAVPAEFRKPPQPPPIDTMKLKRYVKELGGTLGGCAHLEDGPRPLVIRA